MPTLLIIEDDTTLTEGLMAALSFHHMKVITARDGRSGLKHFTEDKPDLTILDLMLPDIDGYDICRRIRERDPRHPIMILSAKSQEGDKLLGFELGAHDYLTKPFSIRELLARIQVHLSHLQPPKQSCPSRATIGVCRIDLSTYTVIRPEGTLGLTALEQKLLGILWLRKNQVVAREEIVEHIWGEAYDPSPKSLDNLIHRLRKKIEKDPARPEHLLNIHGVGYKLSPS